MKYKVGDRVRIVDKRTGIMNQNGLMDKWLGKVMTIRVVYEEFNDYRMEEDFNSPERPSGWTWNDDMIAGLANTITIEIDPANPTAAHAAVSDAISAYKKKQREWTDEEIEQAKFLSRDLILKLWDAGCDIAIVYNANIEVRAYKPYGDNSRLPSARFGGLNSYTACPIGNDIFNEHIGKCVCLCKLTNTPVPKFIIDKNKED